MLIQLEDWFQRWRVKPNPTKIQAILFRHPTIKWKELLSVNLPLLLLSSSLVWGEVCDLAGVTPVDARHEELQNRYVNRAIDHNRESLLNIFRTPASIHLRKPKQKLKYSPLSSSHLTSELEKVLEDISLTVPNTNTNPPLLTIQPPSFEEFFLLFVSSSSQTPIFNQKICV